MNAYRRLMALMADINAREKTQPIHTLTNAVIQLKKEKTNHKRISIPLIGPSSMPVEKPRPVKTMKEAPAFTSEVTGCFPSLDL